MRRKRWNAAIFVTGVFPSLDAQLLTEETVFLLLIIVDVTTKKRYLITYIVYYAGEIYIYI